MKKLDKKNIQVKPKLIFTVGISGSGKSTWINTLNKRDYVIVSFDILRRELTGDVNDHSTSEEVRAIAYKTIIDSLNTGKNVVLDALNVSSRGRRKNIEYIKNNVSIDFDLYAKIFEGNPELSKQRIVNDLANGVDRADVPPEAIDSQFQSYNANIHKLEDEGFKIMK